MIDESPMVYVSGILKHTGFPPVSLHVCISPVFMLMRHAMKLPWPEPTCICHGYTPFASICMRNDGADAKNRDQIYIF